MPFQPVTVELPTEVPPELIKYLARLQFIVTVLGLIFGVLCITGGIVLFVLGITGNMSITGKLGDKEIEIVDAAPGAVLFLVGLAVAYLTRFVFKIADPAPDPTP